MKVTNINYKKCTCDLNDKKNIPITYKLLLDLEQKDIAFSWESKLEGTFHKWIINNNYDQYFIVYPCGEWVIIESYLDDKEWEADLQFDNLDDK